MYWKSTKASYKCKILDDCWNGVVGKSKCKEGVINETRGLQHVPRCSNKLFDIACKRSEQLAFHNSCKIRHTQVPFQHNSDVIAASAHRRCHRPFSNLRWTQFLTSERIVSWHYRQFRHTSNTAPSFIECTHSILKCSHPRRQRWAVDRRGWMQATVQFQNALSFPK